MRRYDSYKHSGVEWIGEIPEGWEVKKVKYITKLQGGYAFKSDAFTDSGIPVIRIGDIKTPLEFDQCKCINEVEKIGDEFALQKNDTLIALSGATTGKMCFVGSIQQKAFINQRVARANFPNKLIYFVLLSNFVQKQILLTADGSAQENISNSQIENISIALPPLLEQTAIASFLDRKTAEIDQLIANKEKLVALYEEEKTAIINRAVTRGLDPAVKTRPSDVDWLGDIPEHWEVKKIKHLFNNLDFRRIPLSGEERGRMPLKEFDYYGASGIIDQVENYIFDGEYILIGEDGANLLTRSTALAFKATGKFWVNNHAHILEPIAGSIDFWVHYLENIDYRIWVSGSAQPKLTAEAMANIDIAVPPLAEQTAIVTQIETECTRLDTIIDKFKKQIELFKEYRTTLISEVVTGKIDVRGEVGV